MSWMLTHNLFVFDLSGHKAVIGSAAIGAVVGALNL
jgi:hypothetical protein